MSEFSSTETAALAAAPSPPPPSSTSEPGAAPGPQLSTGELRAHVTRERQARQERQVRDSMRDLDGPTPEPGAAPPPPSPEPAVADDFPRFWKKEWASDWSNLPPELRARIRDRENERDAHINRTRGEFDQLRRLYEDNLRRAQEAEQHHANGLMQAFALLDAETDKAFADVKNMSPAELARLAVDNPEKYAAFENARRKLVQLAERATQIHGHRVQAQQQQAQEAAQQQKQVWDAWRAAQDREFFRRNHIADAKNFDKVRQDVVMPYLDEIGVSRELAAHYWNHVPEFRSVQLQQMFYDAARYRAAQKSAARALPVAKPPPQQPGSAHQQNGGPPNLEAVSMSEFVRLRDRGVGNRRER